MTTANEAAIIAVAVVLVILIAFLVVRFVRSANNRYGKLWGPLAAIINGKAQGSRLSGTYRGLPVAARITGGGEDTPYYYELTMTPGPSPQDWALAYTGEKFLGTGTKAWRVKSKDDGLQRRMTDAGAALAVQTLTGQPDITYKSKNGVLTYRTQTNGAFDIPSLEQFQAQLDLLAQLSELNSKANTG